MPDQPDLRHLVLTAGVLHTADCRDGQDGIRWPWFTGRPLPDVRVAMYRYRITECSRCRPLGGFDA